MSDPIFSMAAACDICDAEGRIRTTAGGYQECLHQPEDAARVPVSFGRALVERAGHDSYWVTVLDVFVPGVPQPQGNHRVSRAGYTYEANPKLKPWRDAVALVARRAWHGRPPLDQPVAVDVFFAMPRPKRPKFNRPATKPDADKLQRAIGDALETAGVVANDSRIVMWRSSKVYAGNNQPAGARIQVRPAPDEAPHTTAESTPQPEGARP